MVIVVVLLANLKPNHHLRNKETTGHQQGSNAHVCRRAPSARPLYHPYCACRVLGTRRINFDYSLLLLKTPPTLHPSVLSLTCAHLMSTAPYSDHLHHFYFTNSTKKYHSQQQRQQKQQRPFRSTRSTPHWVNQPTLVLARGHGDTRRCGEGVL